MSTFTPQLQRALDLHQSGRLVEAEVAYHAALTDFPDDPNALHLLGLVLAQQGRVGEARPWFQEAISRFPEAASFHANLGFALESTGLAEAAVEAFQRALSLDSNQPLAKARLAFLGAPVNPTAPAELSLREGSALLSHGLPGQAAERFSEGLLQTPKGEVEARLHAAYGDALLTQGRIGEARQAYGKGLELEPSDARLHTRALAALNYDPAVSEAEIFRRHRAWAAINADPQSAETEPFLNEPERARRLRVGYVSGEFCRHATAGFMEALLEAHDPETVEVFGYAAMPLPDAITERLRCLVPHWTSLAHLSDEAAALRIRKDQIDLLVDVGGHMNGGRSLLFARKPAPVQLGYLSYITGTGMQALDYRITDAFVDPEDGVVRTIEKPWRLPNGFHAWRPPAHAPSPSVLPALSAGHVTFGSFNSLAKVNSDVLRTWAEILGQVPRSRLILKDRALGDPVVAQRILQLFEQRGIDPKRVDLVAFLPQAADHFALYGQVDMALDPFPYPGITTTCEALWMGVPVLSLRWPTHAGRMGAGLLHHLSMQEWIAEDASGYVQQAARLASDLPRLAGLRASLRTRMEASPLRDEAGLARNLERAYREMWQAWCERS